VLLADGVGDAVGVAAGEGVGVGVGVAVGEAMGEGVGDGVGAALGNGVGGGVGAAVEGGVGAGVCGGVGATEGTELRVSDVAKGEAEALDAGEAWVSAGLAIGVTKGNAVGISVESGCAGRSRRASRVRLKPARARPTASDGPRSTYSVNDARPAWPDVRSLRDLPPRAPTLVCASYPASTPDKWRQRRNA
jgi:hypothetical protein